MFANKDRFIKVNGKEVVEPLLYSWLRQQIIPFDRPRENLGYGGKLRGMDTVGNKDPEGRFGEPRRAVELDEIAEVRLRGNERLFGYLPEKVCHAGRTRSFLDIGRVWCLKEQDEQKFDRSAAGLLRII